MKRGVFWALASLGLVVAAGVAWRLASRRSELPCPAWLSFLLENPFMETVAGAALLMERASVAPGMHVADVGCGPGRLTIPLAERVGPEGRVLAVDIQPAMIERLAGRLEERGLENVEPRLAAAGGGALEPEAFDRVFLVTVLGEIPNRAEALEEIAAALRPGGVLSVTEVLPDPHFQSRSRVLKLATSAGLEPVATYGNPLTFTVNFRRPPG
jgi:ubiquinone/menaquinone biosynthesis C-methylase UbiE